MPRKHFIFLTGGARSGKSSFASALAGKTGKEVVFIATCTPRDREMQKRVTLHRKSRPRQWKTIEEPCDLAGALKKLPHSAGVVIIDCLTLFISNLMLAGNDEKAVMRSIKALAAGIKKSGRTVIIVSNEVGAGIVPENKLAREFRDIAGKANQCMARSSDEAYAMIAGYPIRLK